MLLDVDQLSPSQCYHAMIQTIVPRPVAWVLSDNGDSGFNLAPFSYFAPVCSEPPLLMISVGKKPDGSIKDTRQNILSRSHFVVHIAASHMAGEVTASARSLPFGQSEVEQLGLELADFQGFSLPRLAVCKVAYGCELFDVKEFGPLPQALLFGRVRCIYLDDSIATQQRGRLQVDASLLDPLARLGGDDYWVDGRIISVARPA